MVSAKDFDAAIDFYENTLGLPLSARYGQMPGAEFETGNLTIAVVQSEAFNIELESKGVKFLADTIDSGVCHMAPFEDSEGNTLLLHHRYAPRE
jgi:predicted enzyme related to lactoylglutathione lyase